MKLKIPSTKLKLLNELAKNIKFTKMVQRGGKPKPKEKPKKNVGLTHRAERESKIEFNVNEMIIGSSSLLDEGLGNTRREIRGICSSQKPCKKCVKDQDMCSECRRDSTHHGCISQISHSGLKNNGQLNESSFCRVIDKLNDEDGSNHKITQPSKAENGVKMKKLDLKFAKGRISDVFEVEQTTANQSPSTRDIQKDLLDNLKSKSKLLIIHESLFLIISYRT